MTHQPPDRSNVQLVNDGFDYATMARDVVTGVITCEATLVEDRPVPDGREYMARSMEDELVFMFDERELRRRLRREYELGRIEGSVIGFISGVAVAIVLTTIAVLGIL